MGEGDFYSMERLVDFGLGMAVASQMAKSMNQSLDEMRMPGVGNAVQDGLPVGSVAGAGAGVHADEAGVLGSASISTDVRASSVYYVVIDGSAAGPYSLAGLARLANEGQICKESYVWSPGMPGWLMAENVPEVLSLMALQFPQLPVEGEGR